MKALPLLILLSACTILPPRPDEVCAKRGGVQTIYHQYILCHDGAYVFPDGHVYEVEEWIKIQERLYKDIYE